MDDLVTERDKYHANVVKPDFTGLAQINGRDKDKLEIPVKTRADSEYVQEGGFFYDIGLFLEMSSAYSTTMVLMKA